MQAAPKLALAALVWGLSFPAASYAASRLSPESICAWRFLLAGAMLLFMVQSREPLRWRQLKRNAAALILMGLSGVVGFNIALFHGLRHTTPTNAALILALDPLFIVGLSALLTRKPVRTREAGGMALGLLGVGVVITGGGAGSMSSLSLHRGDAEIMLAGFCWAIYSVIPERFVHGLSPLQTTAASVLPGALILTLLAATSTSDFFYMPPLPVTAAIAGMALFGTVLAFLWWNDGVSKVGPNTAAIFSNLIPLFAAVADALLGQPPSPAQYAGAVLVVGGVVLATYMSVASITPLGREG